MYASHCGAVLLQGDYSNNAVRLVNILSGLVTTLAGSPAQVAGYADGVSAAAFFNHPGGIALASDATGTIAVIVSTKECLWGVSTFSSFLYCTLPWFAERLWKSSLAPPICCFAVFFFFKHTVDHSYRYYESDAEHDAEHE